MKRWTLCSSCRSRRAAGAALACLLAIPALAGCGKKEPPPSAGGYYEGPMKPKGTTTRGAETGGAGGNPAGNP